MNDLYPSRVDTAPCLLPRHDPVLHGPLDTGSPLTTRQVEDYVTNGYLMLEGLFDETEVLLFQQEAGRLLADPASLQQGTVVTERSSDEIRSIFAVHRQSKLIARLAADRRLAGLASFLLGDEVYLHQSRLNYKPGFQGKEFYWHSDFETWHVEDGMPRMRALSISLLLADNTAHNGPLMLIPGSHHTYISCVGATPADHYKMSLKKQEYGVPDEDSLTDLAFRNGIVAPTGKAGTLLVFDCNVLHGSNGNITPFPRTNAFFVYNAMTNRLKEPFGSVPPRPEHIACRKPEPIALKSGRLTGFDG